MCIFDTRGVPFPVLTAPICVAPTQASVREVKRLDSISRSPVYSSIGEALAGLATIRAYRCEERLSLRNATLVDNSVIMSLVNMSMNRHARAQCCCYGGVGCTAYRQRDSRCAAVPDKQHEER